MTPIADFVAALERRGARVRLDQGELVVDVPAGTLTAEDCMALTSRKAVLRAWLGTLGRPTTAVTLSAGWPKPGSWQYEYATTGRHPLRCTRCGARAWPGRPCRGRSRSSWRPRAVSSSRGKVLGRLPRELRIKGIML